MKNFRVALLLIFFGLWDCGNKKTEERCVFVPDTKNASVDLNFRSLEDLVPAITTKKQLVSFLTRHPMLRDHFFGRSNFPNDSVFINDLFRRFTNPHTDTLLTETRKVFGDDNQLKDQFRQAFSNIKYYYPDFHAPRIETIISGLAPGCDLFVSDSLIVVGLDYFLGKNAKYRPLNIYQYMLRRYQPDFIVPSVLLLYGIDPHINATELGDKSVLADMMAYGKAYYFARHMLPCVPDSVFIGYSSEEIKGAYENEDLIYARLVENEVLYSTSHQVKQRYLDERPKTLEIGEKCPGRIGTWVGWQIVKTYMVRHPDIALPTLMKTPDAEKIFKDSKYRPEHR
jgi:hypothetical protein